MTKGALRVLLRAGTGLTTIIMMAVVARGGSAALVRVSLRVRDEFEATESH